MALRPSLFSRWLVQPTELLHRTALRATQTSPSQSLSLTRSARLTGQSAGPRTNTRRTFTSLASRFATRTRPSLRPKTVQLPRRNARRANSSSSTTQAPKEGGSLSQRLRTLSREYGWAALGVYLGLSALDFPFCFIAVRLLGVERIGHWEHVVVQTVKDAFYSVWPQEDGGKGEGEEEEDSALVKQERSMEEASIWTQLALAYAVHKSLIFFRVPLTAAVTPKIVKVLRRWGWDIGKRKPKST
ncbi:Putative Peptide alpha-N-acetyltransferase [Penicillium brasilianum]|uniref:Putative Peptide alpha-N-acetyltransferase n=1 Tax=Penicillium brasilianum TaxID=104259 RepID=A0A0F7VIA8_PENBI|nr:Putative Peptide alpha-N-acetyltransferase [Penicillium brasilianum]